MSNPSSQQINKTSDVEVLLKFLWNNNWKSCSIQYPWFPIVNTPPFLLTQNSRKRDARYEDSLQCKSPVVDQHLLFIFTLVPKRAGWGCWLLHVRGSTELLVAVKIFVPPPASYHPTLTLALYISILNMGSSSSSFENNIILKLIIMIGNILQHIYVYIICRVLQLILSYEEFYEFYNHFDSV